MHYCDFITAAHGSLTEGVIVDERCGAPASIKCEGRWFCADHYDQTNPRTSTYYEPNSGLITHYE
jgi:hypothetical protein